MTPKVTWSQALAWIAPTVLAGGMVRGHLGARPRYGSHRLVHRGRPPPRDALATEVARLSSILDRRLEIEIQLI